MDKRATLAVRRKVTGCGIFETFDDCLGDYISTNAPLIDCTMFVPFFQTHCNRRLR